MPKVRLLENDELTDSARQTAEAVEAAGGDTSTLRGLAHSQALFADYFRFYTPARSGHDVAEELIELVRLRIARHNDCFT